MRIAFITDLHCAQEGELAYQVDVRQNLRDIVSTLKKANINQLVVGGDLCFKEGRADIYDWQKSIFDALEVPYHIIAGNHDDQKLLVQAFDHLPIHNSEIYYAQQHGEYLLLYLDSGKGHMSPQQKTWLLHQLENSQHDHVVIFMHHPPAKMGVPYMDNNHSMSDGDEVMELLYLSGKHIHVFCGHYHVDRSLWYKNVKVTVTPSLFMQVDMSEQDFAVDHYQIAYRMLDFTKTGLLTSLYYLPGNIRD